MITTVCLNPCIDKTVSVSALVPGGLNRIRSARTDAGGKGVNVAVTLSRLGLDACCVLFLPEMGSAPLTEKLCAEHVAVGAVDVPGSLRINLKVFDESASCITELNESGAPVTDAALEDMARVIEGCARGSELIVLSGSLPPACPADYYRTVMERIARKNVRCVLDADGLRLRAGLEAKPFLVKPNRDELEELTGEPLRTLDDIARAARGLIERGVGIAAVSLGAEGALIADEHDVYCAPRLEIPVRSTVGAGDAMCAGLCAGLARGGSLEEIFRLGMACAGAAVMSEGTRPIERAECEKLLSRVQIRRL